jgi:hypothetical protein
VPSVGVEIGGAGPCSNLPGVPAGPVVTSIASTLLQSVSSSVYSHEHPRHITANGGTFEGNVVGWLICVKPPAAWMASKISLAGRAARIWWSDPSGRRS